MLLKSNQVMLNLNGHCKLLCFFQDHKGSNQIQLQLFTLVIILLRSIYQIILVQSTRFNVEHCIDVHDLHMLRMVCATYKHNHEQAHFSSYLKFDGESLLLPRHTRVFLSTILQLCMLLVASSRDPGRRNHVSTITQSLCTKSKQIYFGGMGLSSLTWPWSLYEYTQDSIDHEQILQTGWSIRTVGTDKSTRQSS